MQWPRSTQVRVNTDPLIRLPSHVLLILFCPIRDLPVLALLLFLPNFEAEPHVHHVHRRSSIRVTLSGRLCGRLTGEVTLRVPPHTFVLRVEWNFVPLERATDVQDMLVRRTVGFMYPDGHLALDTFV